VAQALQGLRADLALQRIERANDRAELLRLLKQQVYVCVCACACAFVSACVRACMCVCVSVRLYCVGHIVRVNFSAKLVTVVSKVSQGVKLQSKVTL
jgi:hypothetical protein